MTEFEKGGIKSLQKIIDYINGEIVAIKTSNTPPNTPRQITNSGKLIAYQKVIQKCQNLQNKIKYI